MCLAAVVYLTENTGRTIWAKAVAVLGGALGQQSGAVSLRFRWYAVRLYFLVFYDT